MDLRASWTGSFRKHRTLKPAVWFIAGLVAVSIVASGERPADAPNASYTFQGRVYEGEVGDQSHPLEGVSVSLYGAGNAYPDPGQLIATTTTNADGWYGLTAGEGWEFYSIREDNPGGYESVGATTVDGTVRNADWIEYVVPLEELTLTGNKFWDSSGATPTPTPTGTPPDTPTPTPTTSATLTHTPTWTPTPTPTPGGGINLTLCAVADAEIDEAQSDANMGDAVDLMVGYGQGTNEPYANRILLFFDLGFIPGGAEVVDAYLEMRMFAGDGASPITVSIYRVDDLWDEMGVTWNSRPATATHAATQEAVDLGVPNVRGWDLRALVQQWVEGSIPNFGIEIRGPEGGSSWSRSFDSRHYTIFCPRLVLTLNTGGTVPTPTPTPTATPTATPPSSCPQPDGGGGSFSTASPISAGAQVEEYICPSGDVDWFEVPVEAPQEINVYLWDLPSGPAADLDVYLYDPTGAEVGSSAIFGAGKGGYINHTATRTGGYRVMVRGKGVADWSPTKTYKLRVDLKFNCDFPDEAGDTFQAATKILPSLPAANEVRKHTGYICPQGDIDFFKVFVSPNQNISIDAKLTDLPADYDLALYDPNGFKIDDSTFGGTADEEVSASASSQPGYWRVKVSGPGGVYHSRPYTLEVILTSNLDLTVAGIEVTQAIQDMSNSVELAAGKIAVARVYVDPGPSATAAAGVEVELHGWQHVGATYKPLPSSPLKKDPLYVTNKTVENDKRLATGESFNFFLPKPWVTSGDIRLEARVNPQHTLPESNYSNNNLVVERVDVRNTSPLNVGLVPIETKGLVPTVKGNPAVASIFGYVRAVYPVGEVKLWHLVGTLKVDHDLTDPTGGGCGEGTRDLLSDLSDIYDWWENRPPNAVVYGFVEKGVPTGWSGCGSSAYRSAVSFLNSTMGKVIAEEIGHANNRLHSPSDRDSSQVVNNHDCRDPGWDTEDHSYPYYTSPTGPAYPRCSIGEVGINVLTGELFDPAKTYDFMAYCWPPWVSPYTWEGIALYMPVAKHSPGRQNTRQVLVAGTAVGDELIFRRWFWVRDREDATGGEGPSGPYTIELRDAGGAVLESREFSVDQSYADGERAAGQFREWIRYPNGVASITVVFEGVDIGERAVSQSPPTVTLTSPNGGEHWGFSGVQRVTWQADDADGDDLSANVLVSNDLGASWRALAVNQTDQFFDVDLSSMPGGNELLLKVEVSDGVNTAFDISDVAFAAEEKPPVPLLISPEAGTLIRRGDGVALSGAALDVQSGSVDGERLTWFSSIDGLIGAFSDTVMPEPSCGAHEIVLEAVNDKGHVEVETTDIAVHGGCEELVYVLPASAHTRGLEGTTWVSDLVLHNPNRSPVHAVLYLLDDGVSTENRRLVVVPSLGSVKLADVLLESFGTGVKSGGMLIASSAPLTASSRTYNDAESGTFGQYVPVEAESAAVEGNEPVTLIQLTRNEGYRTNIGFTNLGRSVLEVRIDLYSSNATYLGSKGYSIDPYSFFQVTDILHKVGADDVDDAYAVIRADDVTASYFTYASIIDNETGDPIYASPVTTSADPVFISAAAHLAGANNTVWRTDLEIYNSGSSGAWYQIELLVHGADNSTPENRLFTLEQSNAVRYGDVLESVFGFEGSAALRITPIEGEIAVTSRTYNQLEAGTTGQFAPGVPEGEAIRFGQDARLIQLSQSSANGSGFRTNIGFANATRLRSRVEIELYAGDGTHLGNTAEWLPPFGFKQLNKIFKRVTDDDVDDGYAIVRTTTEDAAFFCYATVIDNRSGDPILISGRR